MWCHSLNIDVKKFFDKLPNNNDVKECDFGNVYLIQLTEDHTATKLAERKRAEGKCWHISRTTVAQTASATGEAVCIANAHLSEAFCQEPHCKLVASAIALVCLGRSCLRDCCSLLIVIPWKRLHILTKTVNWSRTW